MPTGPHENLAAFLSSLNERTLPQLVADYLVLEGHKKVTVMDGPGDGGRDVHSVKDGQKFLAQCKYHADGSATASSRELSELPMAMIKFGIQSGLFVTTGKISPQAKREYIGEYPSLRLSFLDGPTLANTVFSNPILRALWIDGMSAVHVNRAASFVVIARDMVENRPILLPGSADYANTIRDACERLGLELTLTAKTMCSPGCIPRYAPPARRTISEFGNHINGLGVLVRGSNALREIEHVTQIALHAVATVLAREKHVAVRATTPTLVPLDGPHAGTSIQIEAGTPPTLRSGPSLEVEDEYDFLAPDEQWCSPVRISGATAHNVGWYHSRIDAVLEITFAHRMDEETRSREDINDEQKERLCGESLFALVPSDAIALSPSSGGPPAPPSIKAPWPDGRTLVAWLHPFLVGPFSSFDIEPDVPPPDDFDPFFPEVTKIAFFSTIQSTMAWCKSLPNSEIVSPGRAISMFAVVGYHLVPRSPFMAYRAVDFLRGNLPSPLSLERRMLVFIVCWWIPLQGRSPAEALDVAKAVTLLAEATWCIDDEIERKQGTYLVCRFSGPKGRPECSTRSVVGFAMPSIQQQIDRIEAALTAAGVLFARSTGRYWAEECFIDFSPSRSDGK